MTKYLISRIIRGLISVVILVAIVMILVYSLINRNDIFKGDTMIQKKLNNEKITYKYERWEDYGYLDYFRYSDYLDMLVENGELDSAKRNTVSRLGRTPDKDAAASKEYIAKFQEWCDANGYTVVRLDAVVQGGKVQKGGTTQLFAYKDIPIFKRMWNFFSGLIEIDTIHYVENDEDLVGERGLSFTLYDPIYVGNAEAHNEDGEIVHANAKKKLSPAIMGNGTKYKYLMYFDDQFPYFHQNIVKIHLGTSFAVQEGVDAFSSMTDKQGSSLKKEIVYSTGLCEETSDDLHMATYSPNADIDIYFWKIRFSDKYTGVGTVKQSISRIGLSFVLGIISSFFAYLVGVPIGIMMARHKGKWFDKIATSYIVFILAVPSLAYIFIFRALGMKLGLSGRFDIDVSGANQYVLPIVSLALPSIAGLMQWLRRYMIDQMNSDYVKFARSGGLSEGEIFTKHIFKNAFIPLVHGIPGVILGAVVGGIITETVYSVPGTGRMLTDAINLRDNAVIVGVTAFYSSITIISRILGDILMALVDPRISFTTKAR